MSKQFPKLDSAAAGANAVVFTINQTRINIGVMFGDNTTTTGGKAPGFYASVRTKVTKKAVLKGDNGEELGFVTKLEVTKNRTGFKRGSFEVIMNKGFVPKLAETAVAWAKEYEDLELIDEKAKTICGLPYSGKGSPADLARAIKGKEYLVFEAVDNMFTTRESERDDDVDDQDDSSDEAGAVEEAVTEKKVGKDDLLLEDGEI